MTAFAQCARHLQNRHPTIPRYGPKNPIYRAAHSFFISPPVTKRWDVLTKVGLPRSMPYFFGSLKVAITLAFVGTTVSEMTAANEGIGYLLISAGSSMQMGLAFAGLMVVGAMAMACYELFSLIEKHTTGWAHRGSQSE